MAVRNLQQSHNFREAVKRWGEPTIRKRVIIAPSMRGARAKEVDAHAATGVVRSVQDKETGERLTGKTDQASTQVLYSIDREIAQKRLENEELKEWIAKRSAFRSDLGNLGLTLSWLEGKSDRSACEERVLEKMRSDRRTDERVDPIMNEINQTASPSAQVNMLPLLSTPLPIALAVIADYLNVKRLRLIDLFVNIDKDKNWRASKDEMKRSLAATGIPLSDAQIEELIIALDVNNDDELTYKELARGIEAYHRDSRWQKLKRLYDQIAEPSESCSDFSSMVHDYQMAAEELHEMEREENSSTSLASITPSSQRAHSPVRASGSSHHSQCSAPASDASRYLSLPDVNDDNTDLVVGNRRRRRRERRKQELRARHKRQLSDGAGADRSAVTRQAGDAVSAPMTTLTGDVAASKLNYMKFIEEECRRCIERIERDGLVAEISPRDLRHVLIPPIDRATKTSIKSLSHERSIFPESHEMNAKARRRKQMRMRELANSCSGGESATATLLAREDKEEGVPLPRVAGIDTERAAEGRRRRLELATASPSPCWPQHLLNKLHICMDDQPLLPRQSSGDPRARPGKSDSLFHKILPGK